MKRYNEYNRSIEFIYGELDIHSSVGMRQIRFINILVEDL